MNFQKGLEDRFQERREPDPEHAELERLFNTLAKEHGTGHLLKYIETNTEIAPIVVSEWLDDKRSPSPSLRRAVLNCLRDFQPTGVPIKEDRAVPIKVTEAPKIVFSPKVTPEKTVQNGPKPKRRAPKEWELEGRYQGLNVYESDLLDYLKLKFNDSEFNIKDIKFTEKKARGHRYMFQHLAYLIALNYLEKVIIKDGSYYYKVKSS